MTIEDLKAYLTSANVQFEEKPVQYGNQVRCASGENFTLYDSGKLVPGGVRSELTDQVVALHGKGVKTATTKAPPSQPAVVSKPGKDVFIVYGRDTEARDGLELILRRMGMNPIILSQLPASGDTLIEKLEPYIGQKGTVGYACVLVTPDDEGYIAGAPDQKKYRARQNVVMELGMVLARLGRKRVAILIKNTVEHPSDIAGLIYLPFAEKVIELEKQLYQELNTAGLNPTL
jgi:predicted nucleotide-binding protein